MDGYRGSAMAKIGRNERCPCGSGKKYKRCHGSPDGRTGHVMAGFDKARARADAERVQRERQQGLGKPIISVDFNGRRLVAVKNRLLHSRHWLTFQDFLLDYIKVAIGSEWGNAEIAKPFEQRIKKSANTSALSSSSPVNSIRPP